jgi:hypothetical protein
MRASSAAVWGSAAAYEPAASAVSGRAYQGMQNQCWLLLECIAVTNKAHVVTAAMTETSDQGRQLSQHVMKGPSAADDMKAFVK